MKLGAGPPVTSVMFLVHVQPALESDVGASGTRQCCFEHERQSPSEEAPPAAPIIDSVKGESMDIVVERCAGLDVHKDT
ncbi:MAG: hypothetical protein ACRDH5_00600, partial [bacterium]